MTTRITNSMMLRRYGSNINANTREMDRIGVQVSTFRKFQKGSEDPMSALKALQVRRNLEKMYQETKNLEKAEMWVTQTETAAKSIKDCADKATLLLIQGKNDPLADEDRKIIATELRYIQEELLSHMNTQISGKYILGGANTKERPFTVDEDTGELLFNGENVCEIESIDELEINPVYFDVGLGFRLDEDDDLADPNSVLNMYTPGVQFVGVGKYNLYNLIGSLAEAFGDNEYGEATEIWNEELGEYTTINKIHIDIAAIDGYDEGTYNALVDAGKDPDPGLIGKGIFQRLQDAQLNALIGLVTVGETWNFVNYLTDKNTDTVYLTEVMQNKLEAIEPDKAIMDFKMQEQVYQACLQMGNYILQPTLMSYLK